MDYIYDPSAIYPYHQSHHSSPAFTTSPSALASFYLNHHQQYHHQAPPPGYFAQMSPTNSASYEPTKFAASSSSSQVNQIYWLKTSCASKTIIPLGLLIKIEIHQIVLVIGNVQMKANFNLNISLNKEGILSPDVD